MTHPITQEPPTIQSRESQWKRVLTITQQDATGESLWVNVQQIEQTSTWQHPLTGLSFL